MSAAKKSILKARKTPTPAAERTMADFLDRLPMKTLFTDPEWQTVFEHMQLMDQEGRKATGAESMPFDERFLQTSLDTLMQRINLVKTHAARYARNGHVD